MCVTTSAQTKNSFQLAIGVGGIGAEHHIAMLFNFEPRINLFEFSDKSSLSVGSSIGVGPTGTNDYRTKNIQPKLINLPEFGYMVNLPVTINYTFGNGATPRAYKYMGYSIGAGYAWHAASRRIDAGPGVDTTTIHANGLICDTKINFPIGNSSWSLHASYMFNFANMNPDINGINSIALQYNIGYRIRKREKIEHYKHDRKYYQEIDRQNRDRKLQQYYEKKKKKKSGE
ncbi:hypothetical protein [Chitinophaga sp.]|uniref:hypothetical protein n=1 Tax=Chitinophaga sp. TaxID=1869181 RepID=UPI002F92720D